MFSRRLSSQMNQLQILLTTVLGGKTPQSQSQQAGLVRDEFGLHKMIVAVTKVGKVRKCFSFFLIYLLILVVSLIFCYM